MTIELTEKVIIVTGGASGIGRSIALSLASEKAIVCIIDHNGQAFPDISNEMEEAGGKAFCLQAELTNRDACLNAVNQVFEKFERIDGLVNNAGLNDGVSLENGDIKKFMESFDKNVG